MCVYVILNPLKWWLDHVRFARSSDFTISFLLASLNLSSWTCEMLQWSYESPKGQKYINSRDISSLYTDFVQKWQSMNWITFFRFIWSNTQPPDTVCWGLAACFISFTFISILNLFSTKLILTILPGTKHRRSFLLTTSGKWDSTMRKLLDSYEDKKRELVYVSEHCVSPVFYHGACWQPWFIGLLTTV